MPRIWTTTPVMTVPDGAPGVACAMTGAVWANSATATLFAAAPNDLSITTLIYKNPNPGAAACEAELIHHGIDVLGLVHDALHVVAALPPVIVAVEVAPEPVNGIFKIVDRADELVLIV